jgi:hypothetical protein
MGPESDTSKDLFAQVPVLETDGSNYAVWKLRLEYAMAAKGTLGHLDATAPEPVEPKASDKGPADPDAMTAYRADHQKWKEREYLARAQLARVVRDLTLQKIAKRDTVAQMWTVIKDEYESKTELVQADLRTRFYTIHCPEKGDLRAHLDKLQIMHGELATVGVTIGEAEYRSVIMQSLPKAYASYLSALTSAAHMSKVSLTPDTIITYLQNEYDRQMTDSKRPKDSSSKGKDVALFSQPKKPDGPKTKSDKPASKGFGGECYNCGGVGHRARDCPSPKQEKPKGKDSPKDSENRPNHGSRGKGSKGKQSSNATTQPEDEDGAWVALTCDLFESDDDEVEDPYANMPGLMTPCDSEDEDEDPYADMPELNPLSDSDDEDEEDRLTEMSEDVHDVLLFYDSDDEDENRAAIAPTHVDADTATGTCTDESAATADAEEIAARAEAHPELKKIELYDSGTTKHLSPYLKSFLNFQEIDPKPISAANKSEFNAIGKGDILIEVPNGTDATKFRLTDVLYCPDIGYTLVSIGRIDDAGYSIIFENGKCEIKDPTGNVVGTIPKSKGLYRVVHKLPSEHANVAVEKLTVAELHRRMGHIAPETAKRLVLKGLVTGIELDPTSRVPTFCESCVHAKSTRTPVPKSREGERASKFGEEVHSDLWGPSPVESLGGKSYYVSFTDDATRHTHLYLLRQKSDTFDAYKRFEAWVQTNMETQIKTLRSDRGGEYLSDEFTDHLEEKGTIRKLTVHDTPEQNGVAERLNGILITKVRAMLHDSGLPKFLWGEAVRHAVWLKNRTSTKALQNKTPHEAVTGVKPNLAGLHVWGCHVWVHDATGSKLDSRAKEGQWMGYDEQSKGHRVYWPGRRTVTVERNVTFLPTVVSIPGYTETSPIEGENGSNGNREPLTEIESSEPQESTQESTQIPTMPIQPAKETSSRPTRTRKPTQYVKDILAGKGTTQGKRGNAQLPTGLQAPKTPQVTVTEVDDDDDEARGVIEQATAAVMADTEGLEPRTLDEAKQRPDWPQWNEAILEELGRLDMAGTWELVEKPKGTKVVGSKWVFKAKKDAAGEITKFKARLVAKGFSQVAGVNYFETFAPVATFASSRTILALAASLDLEIHQMDVKSAYLNGELDGSEVVYMQQPPGYEAPGKEHLVCRLQKTLYGLKQSGRRWYEKLSLVMEKLGFKRCEVDQAMFFHHEGEKIVIIAVHVDDLMIAASGKELMQKTKEELSRELEMTDQGEIHWLLGVEIKRDRDNHTISLSQRAYIDTVVADYGLEDASARANATPMDPNTRLSRDQAPRQHGNSR